MLQELEYQILSPSEGFPSDLNDEMKKYLKKNPFESIIDTEDAEYKSNPIVLEKFVSDGAMYYIEFDQRILKSQLLHRFNLAQFHDYLDRKHDDESPNYYYRILCQEDNGPYKTIIANINYGPQSCFKEYHYTCDSHQENVESSLQYKTGNFEYEIKDEIYQDGVIQ